MDWDDGDERARVRTESQLRLREDPKKRDRKMSDRDAAAETTNCRNSKDAVDPNPKASSARGSCTVLPWSVNCDNRDGGFVARLYWPKSMWETVRKLNFRPPMDPHAVHWRHRVGGTFKTPTDAREALDTFIHGLACSELKLLLFA